METICKTWRCDQCSKSLMRYFHKRVRFACRQGPSYFITVTFRLANNVLHDAPYAQAVLTKFLRDLKSRFPTMWYLKVPELTKRGQIHYHLLVGRIGDRNQRNVCCGRVDQGRHLHKKDWSFFGNDVCGCLEHGVSRAWYLASGDSYVVQVDRVFNPKGAGSYLSKYFSKTFTDHAVMWDRGYKRRFIFSRNSPQMDKMQLQGTVEERWVRTERYKMPTKRSANEFLRQQVARTSLIRVGEQYIVDEEQDAETKRKVKKINAYISTEIRTEDNSGDRGRGAIRVSDTPRGNA